MTYKIMIVDDQQVNLLLLGKTLSNHGFEVCTALTGVQCLDMVHIETPDLIILDIDMP